MNDDPYLITGTSVLRNKLDLRDAAELDRLERLLVVQRTIEGPPQGKFDLAHLKAIHHHLFQDVYEWAGEIRTLEINKGGSQFQFSKYIETGMADVHQRLVKKNFLQGLSAESFAAEAAAIIGDVNYVHPFREGNGRAQLEFLRQLGERAGHQVAPDSLDPNTWQHASRAAFNTDYGPMTDAILRQAMGHSSDDNSIDEAMLHFWNMNRARGSGPAF